MMPKKREAVKGEDDVLRLLPPHKRHKKHKHKKHKRKRGTDQEEEALSPPASPQSGDGGKPALKLKIKIGGQQALEKNVTRPDEPNSHSDDEEEAWLEALESGRLEEVDDELRKMKDPTLMTARQRALLESKSKDRDEDGGPPAVQVEPIKEMTEEMIQRRMQRARKRKQQAEEKKEKDKKQTIERLLKKSESRLRACKKPAKKADTPKVSLLRSSEAGTLLVFPPGLPFPLAPAVAPCEYPQRVLCSIKGCSNPRKYSCSKTGVSLCSLECYKANMLQMCV